MTTALSAKVLPTSVWLRRTCSFQQNKKTQKNKKQKKNKKNADEISKISDKFNHGNNYQRNDNDKKFL